MERVEGGLTNEVFRVERDGRVVAIKRFATSAGYAVELACLSRLRHVVPVPHVVAHDDAAHEITYEWIDGITLNELRRTDAAAFATLAGSLGKLLARLATVPPLPQLAAPPAFATLLERARPRLGGELADALRELVPPAPPASCIVHGDLSGRNILVHAAGQRWRVAAVIDWERACAGSPLDDIGHLVRFAKRFDAAFRTAFARGYRAGRGTLAETWWLDARTADARDIVATFAAEQELAPELYADLRAVLARLIRELRAPAC